MSFFLTQRERSVPAWILGVVAGLVMLYYLAYLHGIPKLMGDPGVAAYFGTIGFGMVGLYASGVAETFGPLLMLHWRTSFWGSAMVFVNVLTALIVVYVTGGGVSYELLAYAVVALIVGWLMRPGFLRPAAVVTRVEV